MNIISQQIQYFLHLESKTLGQIIYHFLQLVDNGKLGEKYPLAAKIQPVWDYCNEKFQSIYTPRKYILIDESLLLWKGRLSWKQSI